MRAGRWITRHSGLTKPPAPADPPGRSCSSSARAAGPPEIPQVIRDRLGPIIIASALILPDVAGFGIAGMRLDLEQAQDELAALKLHVDMRQDQRLNVTFNFPAGTVELATKAESAAGCSPLRLTRARSPDRPHGRVNGRFWRFGWPERDVAFTDCLVSVLNGAQPGSYAGFAGGDGLAVAPAVGAFGQADAEAFDLTNVSFALISVRGEGEHGDAGGGDVQDEGHGPGLGVVAGQGGDPGAVGLGPGLPWVGMAVPGPGGQAGQHDVGAVDLVAGGAEVLPDRAEIRAAGGAVLHEPGGLRLVAEGAGAGVDAQLGLQRVADRPAAGKPDQGLGEVR
jgi:hypothetical protein